ncbi:helix-turn-helix domain-containing protein [Vibrio ulleungensis]|uniref:Helix-turn-helix domain-containing protein n=1 Tax=Vibrio ulleungensis TaxID=2807619 RepID=A0ABS2HIQ7_9VIBR|nr:helix-turn-helix domain-containing protein [Vibrio ulleungensis]MBM7037405.1 helix-turn-helix domain-containing protein [Vibrio ulleungensis]
MTFRMTLQDPNLIPKTSKYVGNGLDKIIKEPLNASELLVEFRAPLVMKEYHWHEHIEINVIHNGQLTYELSGHEIKFEQGSIVAFWATVPHRVTAVSDDAFMTILSVPVHILFNWRLHNNLGARLLNGDIARAMSTDLIDISECRRWHKYYASESSVMQDITSEEVGLFLRRLSYNAELIVSAHFEVGRPDKNISASTAKHVHQMISYISANFQDPITVDDVATAVKLNPKYAMNIFHNMLDMTIKKYITNMRIHRARVLLTESTMSVSQISQEAGFRSASAFYSTFQSSVGLKPLEYRKNNA